MRRVAPRTLLTTLRSLSNATPSTSGLGGADPSELAHFQRLVADWMSEQGPMKPLHSMNRVRVLWIVEEVNQRIKSTEEHNSLLPLNGLRIADIGSGSGILLLPLAKLGAEVVGNEPTTECCQAAEHLSDQVLDQNSRSRIEFINSSAEELVYSHPESFDVVIASEIIEHVADPAQFVSACVRLAKPSAPLFFTTINRIILSRVVAVELAEGLGFLPRGMHQWNKFVKPSELSHYLIDSDCKVLYPRGLMYDPLLNEWDWFFGEQINYGLLAKKV